MNRYRTVARDAQTEIEVKRSVFRCDIARIVDEQGARAVVEAARAANRDARHHCSAFIWTPTGGMSRSSDDGEPSGTAGAPMLEVLRGAGLTEVVAVVTRWFGGTLLGAGGLVRAYSDAVAAGLERAGVRERELVTEAEFSLDHGLAARVESELRAKGLTVLDVGYAERVTLRLGVPEARWELLEASLAELTHGSVAPERVGERWVDLG
ncbi:MULTISPECIES: IMPACT family protein [unclassified Luteococcus]|uniref:IMPACT family protein n=1 Tax=unclassified Luteococcus TaxID=2639923 RepID=UPI00313EE1E9